MRIWGRGAKPHYKTLQAVMGLARLTAAQCLEDDKTHRKLADELEKISHQGLAKDIAAAPKNALLTLYNTVLNSGNTLVYSWLNANEVSEGTTSVDLLSDEDLDMLLSQGRNSPQVVMLERMKTRCDNPNIKTNYKEATSEGCAEIYTALADHAAARTQRAEI